MDNNLNRSGFTVILRTKSGGEMHMIGVINYYTCDGFVTFKFGDDTFDTVIAADEVLFFCDGLTAEEVEET